MSSTAPNGQPTNEAEEFVLGPRKTPALRIVGGTDPMSKLDLALYYASKGFPILPLQPDNKVPFDKASTSGHPLCGGVNLGTRDPEKIRRWFRDHPDINYGLRLDGRTAVDIDTTKGEHWRDEFESLTMIESLPETLANGSARDGFHVLFEGESKNQHWKSARNTDKCSVIDIISGAGRYVVGPGSTFDGKPYRVLRDLPIAPLSDNVSVFFEAPAEPQETKPRKAPPDPAIIRDALKHCDPEPYENWRNVGMALKLAYLDYGKVLWDEFSERSEKFDRDAQDKAWQSFRGDSDKPRTVASIIHRLTRTAGQFRPRSTSRMSSPTTVASRSNRNLLNRGSNTSAKYRLKHWRRGRNARSSKGYCSPATLARSTARRWQGKPSC